MFKRKFFLKLGFETIAIIIGISASFWINEISIKKDNDTQRIRVLNNILIENEDIKRYCNERMNIWSQDIEIFTHLLDKRLNLDKIENIVRSKRRVEYNLIYYRDFEPPMNRYKSIINTGDLKYIKSENIKEILTRLHNLNYLRVASTVEYEKEIKEKVISLLTKENPSLFIKSNNSAVSFETYINLLHEFIQENDRLKSNLIVQMRYFKTRISSLKLYMITLKELEEELRNIKGFNL